MSLAAQQSLESHYVMHTFGRSPVEFVEGQFLSALVLLVLFRPEGSVRASKTGIVLGFIPVSYTHLDVYKRQGPAWSG